MKGELSWLLVSIIMASLLTAGLVLGLVTIGAVLFVAVFSWLVVRWAASIATDADRSWLSTVMLVAFLTRVFATVGRYLMVTVVYGVGDSLSYHRAALDLVHVWRSFRIPQPVGHSASTRFTEQVTSLLYVPGEPSLIGSFLFFSFFAFVGMVCFYLAFRRSAPRHLLKPYAIALFFLPSLLFWPSSIGKDSLMVLAIGVVSLGSALLFERRWWPGLALLIPGLGLAVGVRTHVAALLAGGIAIALAGSRHEKSPMGPFLRFIVTIAAVGMLLYFGSTAAGKLGLDTTSDGLDQFLAETERLTAQGGSAVVGTPVLSPVDLPEAFLRVLFRPLPGESFNPPLLLSSLESGLLFLFTLVRLPTIIRNYGSVRRNPYYLYATVYSLAFVVAFSAIFNLGILARQRVQVFPLLLVVLIGLGWREDRAAKPDLASERVEP